MMRSLGRNWATVVWVFAWLLPGGGATAQVPEQHWQPTQNYPQNTPPNYQPSTAPAAAPANGTPAAGTPAAGQYRDPQQPDQPVGPPPYPTIDRRQPPPVDQAASGNQLPDNRATYPQYRPVQGLAGQGLSGPPIAGQTVPGPPVRPLAPQVQFVLSPQEMAALDNLLTDWEKRNKEIHVLESTFFRWKYDTVFAKPNQPPPLPEKGTLRFAAPDKGQMIIEAKDPKNSEQWLCDGRSIYQFDYTQNEVTEFVMPPELQGKGIGDGPLPFVFGIEAQKLKQRYFMKITTPPSVQNEVWLDAYPRYQQQRAEFSKVQVILQLAGPTKSLLPYAIQIFSPNGKDRTVYQLQDPTINPKGGWFPIWKDWWKVSIPYGWKKKVELPQPPVQARLSPSLPRR